MFHVLPSKIKYFLANHNVMMKCNSRTEDSYESDARGEVQLHEASRPKDGNNE